MCAIVLLCNIYFLYSGCLVASSNEGFVQLSLDLDIKVCDSLSIYLYYTIHIL